MAFGIEVFNDDGALQLSSEIPTPSLVASGNMTTTTNLSTSFGGSEAAVSYTRASTAHHPMLAIRPSAATMLLYVADTTTLTWEWRFISSQAVGSTIPYWIFDLAAPPADTYGIHVFNAAGTRTFSSAGKPLRIRDVITSNWTAPTSSLTYDTGRTYAAILTRWSERLDYRILPNVTDQYGLGVSGITNGIFLSGVKISEGAGDGTPTPWPQRNVLIADVTNY